MLYKKDFPFATGWSLEIDLVSDLQEVLYKRMIAEGLKNVDKERALFQYFNTDKRFIRCTPRKVYRSKEFTCPEGYEKALENFVAKVERGENLTPFLSTTVKDASFNDGLLNDWNIHHFHLTNRFNEDGTAKRSDYEIFAYVTDTDMYMIQVYLHKDQLNYWHKEMIAIIYSNWPELIEKYRLKDVRCTTERLDDEGHKAIRNSHITTPIELDENRVFARIGGGYTADGSSAEAMRLADRWHNQLRLIQILIADNMDDLSEAITQVSGINTDMYDIKLLWIEGNTEFTFGDRNHQVIVQLNVKESRWRVCKPIDVFGFDFVYRTIDA